MFSLLPVALLSLLAMTSVFAKNDLNISALNNSRGQAPCELAKDLVTPCGSQSRARAELVLIDGRPQPSNCTCNNIFFNVWSACLFSNGNSTLPISDQWKSECNQKSINFTDGYVHMAQFDVPSWAFVSLPQNATFDVRLAIDNATRPEGWTTAQRLASVVVGLGSAIVFSIMFALARRWKLWSRIKGWRRNRQTGFPMVRRRVRSVHKADLDGFFIDNQEDENFEDVGYPSAHGHNGYRISLPLYKRDRSPSVGPVWSLPGKSFWKKLSIKGRLQDIPRPWKRRPIPVKSFPAPNNWRLDGRSSITRSPHSGHFSIKFPFTNATNGPSKLREEAIFEDPDNYSDSGSDRDRHEHEHASLISPPRPRPPEDVMIISPNGDDFTLESGETQPGRAVVRVTPPSPKIPSRTGPHHHPPRIDIPPAPREPAPQPPIIPRPAVSTNTNSTPSAHPQHPQIEETIHSKPRKSSADTLRRNNARVRRVSAELTPSRSPSYPPPSHYYLTPHAAPSQFPPSNTSHEYLPVLSSFQSRSGSRPGTPEPALGAYPLVPHRRGYSSGDAAPQFQNPFQRSTERLSPGFHSRNISADSIVPLRSDPVMLFPGAVRGAGYNPRSMDTDTHPRTPPGVFTPAIYHNP